MEDGRILTMSLRVNELESLVLTRLRALLDLEHDRRHSLREAIEWLVLEASATGVGLARQRQIGVIPRDQHAEHLAFPLRHEMVRALIDLRQAHQAAWPSEPQYSSTDAIRQLLVQALPRVTAQRELVQRAREKAND
jgi:hypothetical protein